MGQWVVSVLGLEPLHLRVTLVQRMRWLQGYLTARPRPRRRAGSTAGRRQVHERALLYCAAGAHARACGVPELGHWCRPGLLRSPLVFAEEAAEDGPALDPLLGEIGDRVVGTAWVQLAADMGATSVVVSLALDHDCPQLPLAEDQHPVGDLRPGCEHEP